MNFKVLLVYCNTMMDNLIPVGLSSVAASLRNSGIEVKLFDTTFYRTSKFSSDEVRVNNYQIPPFSYSEYGVKYKENNYCDDFESVISSFGPDLIAFSVVEPTYELALNLLQRSKKYKVSTVIGGIHAIFNYKDIICNDAVDMVCLGEAETYLPQLCLNMAKGKDYWHTPNFWIKNGNFIFKNKIAQSEELSKLPLLDVSIYEAERFYRPMAGKIYKMMPIEFSRGCPFACTYCADAGLEKIFKERGGWLRLKPIDKVIDEIKFYIQNYQITYFYFVSETFLAVSDKRIDEFVEKYSEIKIPFWFNTRPETITERRIKKLISVGCHRISVGVEHGNEEFRRNMLNRKYSNETIRLAFKILNDYKISYSVNNVIGFPEETRSLIFDTIEVNRISKSNSISCHVFAPYRGTKMRDYCIQKGYIDSGMFIPDFNFDSVLNMPTISKAEISALARTFAMYVKFPKDRWPSIRLAEEDTPQGRRLFKKLGKEFVDNFFMERK